MFLVDYHKGHAKVQKMPSCMNDDNLIIEKCGNNLYAACSKCRTNLTASASKRRWHNKRRWQDWVWTFSMIFRWCNDRSCTRAKSASHKLRNNLFLFYFLHSCCTIQVHECNNHSNTRMRGKKNKQAYNERKFQITNGFAVSISFLVQRTQQVRLKLSILKTQNYYAFLCLQIEIHGQAHVTAQPLTCRHTVSTPRSVQLKLVSRHLPSERLHRNTRDTTGEKKKICRNSNARQSFQSLWFAPVCCKAMKH